MANATDLVIHRTFDAPRELVFRTMTDPEHLRHWWGPKECTISVVSADVRPGGVFHYCMHPRGGVEGMDAWGRFDYREIEPAHRIVYVNGFADEAGNRIRYPLLPLWPLEVLNTVTLEEDGGRTHVTMHSAPIDASEAEIAMFAASHASMQQGFGGMLDVYEEYLRTVQG